MTGGNAEFSSLSDHHTLRGNYVLMQPAKNLSALPRKSNV